MDIRVKRAYEPASRSDGTRVLVDRLWPRGVSREKADIKAWWKEIAPSDDLRAWFGHDPAKWESFRKKYARELDRRRDCLDELVGEVGKDRRVTFVFSARDEDHNNAVALKDYLEGRIEH